MRRIGAVVGQYVASPVVESMDVNAIVNEIDWNEVLEKVDINEVIFDRIDVNRLLDRVDVNRHLDRVDVNQHLEKVDWDALVERSNLEEIIARSTSGVLSGFASLLRTRLAWIDQWGQRVGRCYCCGKNRECVDFLPPRPGRPEDSRAVWKTPETLDKLEFERAIQFRTCGATSHLLFLSLDWMFLWTVFAAVAAIVNELTIVFAGDPDYWDKYPSVQNFWFDVFLYAVAAALYWVFMVGCVGRTFGMWILGLVMVTTEGKRVSLVQVCKQVLLIPPNMLLFGWVLGYTRRDGAFASDILGDVSVVYAWGARLLPKNKHPEMAMSLGDFVESIPEHERENLLKVPENLNVRLGGDDYNGDDDACLDNDSVKGNSGSVEITNLEDAASRWSKENI
jgi:uncharacterized RDD family membrane protein YckC